MEFVKHHAIEDDADLSDAGTGSSSGSAHLTGEGVAKEAVEGGGGVLHGREGPGGGGGSGGRAAGGGRGRTGEGQSGEDDAVPHAPAGGEGGGGGNGGNERRDATTPSL